MEQGAKQTRKGFKRWAAMASMLLILIALGCIDPYTPPTTTTDVRLLVIDGFYNGSDTTVIKLTRTQTLQSIDDPRPEQGANVTIEEQSGGSFILPEKGNGVYTMPPGLISGDKNVRLHIILQSGTEYASPFVPIKPSPAIDSVSWKPATNDGDPGIEVSVTTHDPAAKAVYYLWNYEATWEYSARYQSSLERVNDSIFFRPDDIYHCWVTERSSRILIYSTTALSTDEVSEYPLTFVNKFSPKLSFKYSLLVHQYALTAEAYLYYQTIQKNTENLGTVFGPLPAQVTGNITNITNPSVPALGFFFATDETHTRFFVKREQLPSVARYDDGYDDCFNTDAFVPLIDALLPTSNLYLFEVYVNTTLIGYQVAPVACTDCRLKGGKNVIPSFW